MIIENELTQRKICVENGKITAHTVLNKLTGQKVFLPDELFAVRTGRKSLLKKCARISSRSMVVTEITEDILFYKGAVNGAEWRVLAHFNVFGAVQKLNLYVACDTDAFIDGIEYANVEIEKDCFSWSRPVAYPRVYVKPFIAALGQPVYYKSFYLAVEFPTADNRIENDKIILTQYGGRKLSELISDGGADKLGLSGGDIGVKLKEVFPNGCYSAMPVIIGAAIGDGMNAVKKSFFDYVHTIGSAPRFVLQYNSWYDNMLDINSENIRSSFTAISEGFKRSGLRPLDSYVVDDGWCDYTKKEFWAFNSDKFPNEFYNEKALTESFGSTFGVWFGPRGGYSVAFSYARKLKKIGYNICAKSMDICTGDPKYVKDLGERMAHFMREFNVNYFKIDGFAVTDCISKKHGHPTGGKSGVYFYQFLWERWIEVFIKLRTINPKVFLNITSYAHCSPFFLRWADAVWINNAADMGYAGKGSNLNQCLCYRDGRYYDFTENRQFQFPVAYIYNHEPVYATRNYNPPLPNKSHKTVFYTDAEFKEYLLMHVMRGTGFIEMYYTPAMLDGNKLAINAEVMKWAEDNFNIICKSVYHGGVPEKGEPYGYVAYDNGVGYLSLRNPDDKEHYYTITLSDYTHKFGNVLLRTFYGDMSGVKADGAAVSARLKAFESVIVAFKTE